MLIGENRHLVNRGRRWLPCSGVVSGGGGVEGAQGVGGVGGGEGVEAGEDACGDPGCGDDAAGSEERGHGVCGAVGGAGEGQPGQGLGPWCPSAP